MSLLSKLFSFSGRLRRRDFWLLTIGLIAVWFVAQWGLTTFLGSLTPTAGTLRTQAQQQAASTAVWVALAGHLLFQWPFLAVWIKRAHDIDNRATVVIAFYGLSILFSIAAAFTAGAGFVAVMSNKGRPDAPPATEAMAVAAGGGLVALILGGVLVLWALYLVVTLGFYDGTRGPNRFGPSPKYPDGPTETFA